MHKFRIYEPIASVLRPIHQNIVTPTDDRHVRCSSVKLRMYLVILGIPRSSFGTSKHMLARIGTRTLRPRYHKMLDVVNSLEQSSVTFSLVVNGRIQTG